MTAGSVSADSGVTGSTASGSESESGSGAGSIDANHTQAFSIASGDKMLLSVNVDELDILSVAVGQDAEITFDALEGQSYTGKITEISDSASVSGGVARYAVKIELAKDENMRAGMNASATITIESKEDIITIPLNALQEQGGKTFVYTQKNEETGQLSGETEVETGLSDGENVEITSGLSEGDTVYYHKTGSSESEDSIMVPDGGVMMFEGGAMPDGEAGGLPVTQEAVRAAGRRECRGSGMIFQSLKMAWSAITSNKMRSFLTMLGIIIGVMSLVVLVSIVNGATTSVTDSISDMGTNLLRVSITDDKENPLRLSELQDFTDNDDIAAAAPTAQSSMTGKSGYTSETTTVYGTTGDYLDIMGLKLGYGRFLKSPDVDNHSYVVILSYDAAIELIGRADAVGETVALDGRSFEVVGVLAEDTSGMNSMSSSSPVLEAYIPYTTFTRMADNVLYVTSFCASAVSEETLDAAEATLTELMMNRFGQDEDAFTIQNQSTLMETMSSVTDTMSMMLGGIAAISLLVGESES